MYPRLLDFLRCPECHSPLALVPLVFVAHDHEEVSEGLLHCDRAHWFPIVGGIPRMLPDALLEHWDRLAEHVREANVSELDQLEVEVRARAEKDYDRTTRANFSLEWDNYEIGDRTWGMALENRVRGFFLRPIRTPVEDLKDLVMLDAGCGNGSQSVAYSEFGIEVVALDLSSGLEHGHAFRHQFPEARPDKVHFVQGDIQSPPFSSSQFDIIHSMGVLHHTSDTRQSYRTLCELLKPDGTFCVWLYSYERWVTPTVNAIRAVTTRIPPSSFAKLSNLMASAFQLFCLATNALGVRAYPRPTRREAALALMDIFGAPYAHYHSFDEVAGWYRDQGFDEVWEFARSRRGFGVGGRRVSVPAFEEPSPIRSVSTRG